MIILVDGHSIAFRAFYALPDTLVTKDGFPTNVIHGFLMMISKLVKEYSSEKIIITWDISKKTFRTELYSEYKGCLLYTSPSPRDGLLSRMPSSA